MGYKLNRIYLWTRDVTDTQGPAPDGFHVPLDTERQAVYNVWTALGGGSSDGTNFGIALKLPLTGNRNYSTASVAGQGEFARYWSVSKSNSYAAYNLNFLSSGINPQNSSIRAIGFSIRCFKNTPVIPTSSWTKLYGTSIEAGGIFWSSTDGLISLSSDGNTWITIADKNLGATQVRNSGDTLSEANCGKYYQRGNNYGFPFTGSVTTSSTQVNAGSYGPGNYYNSSTFITGNQDRSSVHNDNLRGGVTGIMKEHLVYPSYLCFTANTAGSTIRLTKTGSPTSVTLETSTDGKNWSTYTIGDTITLSNIGDKVYWRNTSTTDTRFSTDTSNYYKFIMNGSISASGDTNYLLNKNSTTTLSNYCYYSLFLACSSMTTAPQLPATTLANGCYRDMFNGCTSLTTVPKISLTATADYCFYEMFRGCTNLTSLPKLPATALGDYCYSYMFYGCSKIKLSKTQTGEYQTAYRIPTDGTGTMGTGSLNNMFSTTGGTFTSNPSINTTYYTSNTVV